MKKFRVSVNPEESKIVQETIFKLGYAWNGKDKETIVKHTDAPILTIWEDKTITYGCGPRNGDMTFKQFQLKYNLTNKNMKYKLIKPEYLTAVMNILFGNTSLVFAPGDLIIEDKQQIDKLRKAEVLDKWFKLVVDEYKVGDYFTVVTPYSRYNGTKGETYKIVSIHEFQPHNFYISSSNTVDTTKVEVRKATEDEIKDYELIEECKKRYPIGTKFHAAHMPNTKEYCIVTNTRFIIKTDGFVETPTDEGDYWDSKANPKYGNTTHNRVVYANGVWARIVDEEPIRIEKLLAKANKDYPKGTNYRNVFKLDKNNAKVRGAFAYFPKVVDHATKEMLSDGYGGAVYYDGKWAEILPNKPTIIIAGKEVEYFDGYIKIGCTDVYLTTIKELVKLPIDFISIRGYEAVSILTLQQIVDYYETL